MAESTQITIHKSAEGDLIGSQRVDSQATFDGRYYKVYVLLRYPLNENNSLRKEREQIKVKRETELRAARAQQELEKSSEGNKADQERADAKLKQEIGPREDAKSDPIKSPPAVVGAQTVPTSGGELKLFDVDNKEYKQKRAEALAKPGAVVGQTIIQAN
jgi:hypothetical protein